VREMELSGGKLDFGLLDCSSGYNQVPGFFMRSLLVGVSSPVLVVSCAPVFIEFSWLSAHALDRASGGAATSLSP
jgi:hypothetical protein